MTGSEERFYEVAGDDLVRRADGRQVHAGIPTEYKIDVCRYLIQLVRAEGRVVKKGAQQSGDAGCFHEGVIVEDRLLLVDPGSLVVGEALDFDLSDQTSFLIGC